MKALIFAAGLGTRLKPLTNTIPKALVVVGRQPLLEHVIIKLKNGGFDDIVVNIHHFGDQIIDFLANNNNFGVKISISDERDLLRETGGGIKYAQPKLYPEYLSREPFLVHNVDIISNLDLKWFWTQHKSQYLSTLLVSDRDTSRYLLFNDDDILVGWTNLKTGEVKSPYSDLQVDQCKKMAFAGIHIISPLVFSLMNSWPEKFSIIDFYLSIADKYPIKGVQMPG
ncbi:MAG: sugar phosphate nucleotidyltransferase, partial [Bacteroidales bacterium]